MPEKRRGKLAGSHMAWQSEAEGLSMVRLRCTDAEKQCPNQEPNASINIRICLMFRERPAAKVERAFKETVLYSVRTVC